MSSCPIQLVLPVPLFLFFAHTSVVAADTCTFDEGICPQWVSSNCNENACFQARNVSSMQFGPSYDHSNKSVDGWSAYVIQAPNVWNGEAELTRKVKGPFCFTGWYHQSGTQVTMAAFILDMLGPYTRKFFHESLPDKYGRWQRVRYSEKRTGDFEVGGTVHLLY
ncbi:hypothetical protein MTO96_032544 [Rhipicephalus appendiculatus]